MKDKYGLLGIGNAIVDVITQVDEQFITDQNMVKGSMTLVDQETSDKIFSTLPESSRTPGGSAGNTMAGFASFGGSGAYIGKLGDDQLGQEFRDGMKAQNVEFTTPATTSGTPTAVCIAVTTPDAERTMSTYLGAAGSVSKDDIDEELIKQSSVTYLEGYLFDTDASKEAFHLASELTHKHGKLLSMTLSDSFCVERFREEFKTFIKDHIDILFANEDELLSLYETDDLDAAITELQKHVKVGAVTRSKKGSIVVTNDSRVDVAAIPPAQLVDTNGAGDSYAAGFLYGYTEGYDLAECGRLGSLAASEVISHLGARTETNLGELAKALDAA